MHIYAVVPPIGLTFWEYDTAKQETMFRVGVYGLESS
jgi:hypothetical protein